LLYADGDEFIGRGHASTPLTPDPNKLYQRVVTPTTYTDNRKYKNRLFKNEVVDGGNGTFYKVLKDVDISFVDTGDPTDFGWQSEITSNKVRTNTWLENAVTYFEEINNWVRNGNAWDNYTIHYKYVGTVIVEVARFLVKSVPSEPTRCLDEVPLENEEWLTPTSSADVHILHRCVVSPTLPAFTDTTVYEPLPKYVVSFYYVRPVAPYLLLDKNNTTTVTQSYSIYMDFNVQEDFNSITLAEIVATEYSMILLL